MSALWTALQAWQGLIGSLLGSVFGFIALICGALFNFHLNRKRDAAQMDEEAQTVAACLYGEILLLRVEIAQLARVLSRKETRGDTNLDSHFVAAHEISDSIIYQALANKIGLLSIELNLAITKFHQNVQQTRTWLPRMLPDETRRYNYGASYVLRPARSAVIDILPALRIIEKTLGIQEPAEDIDLGDTEDVLDYEEEIAQTPTE